MRNMTDFFNMVDTVFTDGARRGVMLQTVENERVDGRTVRLRGQDLLHFGSCSYVGLELDERVKQEAMEATARYGAQFASPRGFLSSALYLEFESLLERLFGVPALTAQTTTLAHMSAIPVLIQESDAVILDQQVHFSVQMCINHVRTRGTYVEVLRHNRMDLLVDRIKQLSRHYRNVWYLADGVYSMRGDVAPMNVLNSFLDRFEQFRLYIDDAHGMSWAGKHGRGYALAHRLHPNTTVVTSLAKGFAAAGAAIVIPDDEQRRRVRVVGPTMVFSGPLQPPLLGACTASARIHVSEEMVERQNAELDRIRYCNTLLRKYDLPLQAQEETPIRCVGIGTPDSAYQVVEQMMARGFYVSPAVFPGAPMKRSGIRIALTPHLEFEDIRRFVDALAEVIPDVLEKQGQTVADVKRSFKMANIWTGASRRTPELRLEHHNSIEKVDQAEWDSMLGAKGAYTWEALRFFESTFRGNPKTEHNWRFHYYIVRDTGNKAILATFFTEALFKDDMFSHERVSQRVEEVRRDDPYYLTSRGLSMGSPMTEGDHLYLDRKANWRGAMLLLFEAIGEEQTLSRANTLILRDVRVDDMEMKDFLLEQGFFAFPMPESMVVDVSWDDEATWLKHLSQNSRRHQRKNVLPWESSYDVEVLTNDSRPPTTEELQHVHRLYRNVMAKSYEVNSFELPEHFFGSTVKHPGWELLLLRFKPEAGGKPGMPPVAMACGYAGPEQYVFLVVGLDYRYVRSHAAYRQVLLQVMRRAQAHGSSRIFMGVTTIGEKRCFGAEPIPHEVFIHSSDQYNSEVLAQMLADVSIGAIGAEKALKVA